MQTPASPEGQITEEIMLEWSEKNPGADTRTYNATYSAVLEKVRIRIAAERKKARPSPDQYRANAAGVIISGPSLIEQLAFV